MKKREGDSWLPADEFGQSLTGACINLLVADIDSSLKFQRDVLAAHVEYCDADFALMSAYGMRWMLHADHTYQDHPMHGIATQLDGRGGAIELRLYNTDPDSLEKAARERGYTILQGCQDKPHGLRECYLLDNDGFIWVPGRKLPLSE
ncbi:MAG: hypothetical protein ACI8P9_000592 [Parasphingorhabdus sp.]|jgi:hypothetical protein